MRAFVHHLALRTNDIPALERFYGDVLGLAVLRRSGLESVWLDAGGTILMVERRGPAEPSSIDRLSMELTCFRVEPHEAPAILERLAALGVSVEGRTAYSIYFRDPDGRRVGISSYPEEITL